MFEIIPAIDVMGGRLVRMRGGDPSTLREHLGDPVETAQRFAAAGARWIHVVDLDAALGGGAANRGVLRAIAALEVQVQAGGGLSVDEARKTLEAGAKRAVIGSGALAEPGAVAAALNELGDSVAVGLDVRDGRIFPRGSNEPGPELDWAVQFLRDAGCRRVVHTDVARDGALSGPDLEGLARITDHPWAVIASAGIRSLADLEAVEALGAEGAIVGTAIYESEFDLAEALRSHR